MATANKVMQAVQYDSYGGGAAVLKDVVCGKDANQDIQNSGRLSTPESITAHATENLREFCEKNVQGDENAPAVSDESDNLSDIDDIEVNCYLNNDEEKHFKTIIWEEMNKEYILEQRAKEEAIAAAYENIGDVSDDVLAAKKLVAAAKTKELRRKKRALELKNAGTAKTPAIPTQQMLTKKGLSSKINYNVLDKLFDETPVISAKKSRTESYDGQEGNKEEHEAQSADYKEAEDNERYTEDYENAECYNDNWEEMYNYDDNHQDNWDDY